MVPDCSCKMDFLTTFYQKECYIIDFEFHCFNAGTLVVRQRNPSALTYKALKNPCYAFISQDHA